jgi:hypothetical protein
MMQVLDRFRKEYEKETGKDFSDRNLLSSNKYLTQPTWDYVCWLEKRLSGWEGILRKESYTVTTATTIKGRENDNVSNS